MAAVDDVEESPDAVVPGKRARRGITVGHGSHAAGHGPTGLVASGSSPGAG